MDSNDEFQMRMQDCMASKMRERINELSTMVEAAWVARVWVKASKLCVMIRLKLYTELKMMLTTMSKAYQIHCEEFGCDDAAADDVDVVSGTCS